MKAPTRSCAWSLPVAWSNELTGCWEREGARKIALTTGDLRLRGETGRSIPGARLWAGVSPGRLFGKAAQSQHECPRARGAGVRDQEKTSYCFAGSITAFVQSFRFARNSFKTSVAFAPCALDGYQSCSVRLLRWRRLVNRSALADNFRHSRHLLREAFLKIGEKNGSRCALPNRPPGLFRGLGHGLERGRTICSANLHSRKI
jgi:hypothetical protein